MILVALIIGFVAGALFGVMLLAILTAGKGDPK